jgi:hypothetical protein
MPDYTYLYTTGAEIEIGGVKIANFDATQEMGCSMKLTGSSNVLAATSCYYKGALSADLLGGAVKATIEGGVEVDVGTLFSSPGAFFSLK